MPALQPPNGMRSVEELNEEIRRLMVASGGWLSDEQRVVYADLVTRWSLASRAAPPLAAGSGEAAAPLCPAPQQTPESPAAA